MSDVIFEDEQYNSSSRTAPVASNSLSVFLIKNGFAKDERQANLILLVSAVVLIGASIVVFFSSTRVQKPLPYPTPPPEAIPRNFRPNTNNSY